MNTFGFQFNFSRDFLINSFKFLKLMKNQQNFKRMCLSDS